MRLGDAFALEQTAQEGGMRWANTPQKASGSRVNIALNDGSKINRLI
jgi:hypothetical protein